MIDCGYAETKKFLRLHNITGALFSVTEIMMVMMTTIIIPRKKTKWHKNTRMMK